MATFGETFFDPKCELVLRGDPRRVAVTVESCLLQRGCTITKNNGRVIQGKIGNAVSTNVVPFGGWLKPFAVITAMVSHQADGTLLLVLRQDCGGMESTVVLREGFVSFVENLCRIFGAAHVLVHAGQMTF